MDSVNFFSKALTILKDIWALCSTKGSSNWVHKTQTRPFKEGATLAPKLADPLSLWTSSSTPFLVNWIQ